MEKRQKEIVTDGKKGKREEKSDKKKRKEERRDKERKKEKTNNKKQKRREVRQKYTKQRQKPPRGHSPNSHSDANLSNHSQPRITNTIFTTHRRRVIKFPHETNRETNPERILIKRGDQNVPHRRWLESWRRYVKGHASGGEPVIRDEIWSTMKSYTWRWRGHATVRSSLRPIGYCAKA